MRWKTRWSMTIGSTLVGLSCFWLAAACIAQESQSLPSAAEIYQQKCASCHGKQGQGVADGYAQPLGGEQSLGELTELIVTTMPEDNADQCVGEEARAVAEFVYRQFYATSSNKPAHKQAKLTRLTVPQYRQALADLFVPFSPSEPIVEENSRRRRSDPPTSQDAVEAGLRGHYFQSKGMSKADTLGLERTDAVLAFDFGEEGPAEGITADQFSIIWEGGLNSRDTGYHEFRLRTPNGARLYLNLDPQEGLRKLRDDSSAAGQMALIDAWVGSGELREQTARVFLLGGRTYPIRLEFFKYLEKTASIELEWKPPHGTWSVLDQSATTTLRPPRVYVCDTNFPADDRSLGYERGSRISQEWLDATTSAAIAAAAEVAERLPLLARLTDDMPDREQAVQAFVLQFARVAFRRPLSEAESKLLTEIAFADAPNLEAAARKAVLMILMSPEFLYTDLTPTDQVPSAYAIASRLSLALWDSIPDQTLLDAAAQGELESQQQIESQARRMLADPRTKTKMRTFFEHWLEMEERDLAKDKQLFPDFDEVVIADLRRSLELFIDQIVWSQQADYRELLSADYLMLNERLRQLYQPEVAASDSQPSAAQNGTLSAFTRVSFPSEQRSGVLTHPYLLSAFAYHNNTSPIHRGVFLTRNIVGRNLNPPPMAVAFKDDEFSPELTMREKITQLTRDTACMSCHSVINPLGFTLESFDAVGRWRTSDNNKPVDTKSEYKTAAGETMEVASARDIANFAIANTSSHRAFVTQVFQHLVKQDVASQQLDALTVQFANNDFNVQELWLRIAVAYATGS